MSNSERHRRDVRSPIRFRQRNFHLSRLLPTALVALCLPLAANSLTADDGERFFENSVRPILVDNCLSCHGDELSGGLSMDSRQSLLKGGDSGPALVPGDATASRMLQAVRQEGELAMPPEKRLTPAQIVTLTEWVKLGAPWPESQPLGSPSPDVTAKHHWAFQPVRQPAVPQPRRADWVRTPVDAFVLEKLDSAGLTPAAEADRYVLIRRVTYTLSGLPPSPTEVNAFVNDTDPLAYEHLVDRLLDSPHYGEHWARHWLDVARYSDTKGYVYAREERFWPHAWTYRDWVVQALNEDVPYDRFLLLQLAADQVEDREPSDLAAMGFLTLGRRFLGVKHDIIDDRIDVVTRGTMGLTVGCARCHNHKYDPIPTADYYSLYGIFDSCAERLVAIEPTADEAFQNELTTRQLKLRTTLAESRAESSRRARSRTADYLQAQTELHKYPPEGFDQIFEKTDLLPGFVRRWETYLRDADRRRDPVFSPWHAYRQIPEESFEQQAAKVTGQLQESTEALVNPLVRAAFATAPKTFGEVIERYGRLFVEIDTRWQALPDAAEKNSVESPKELPEPAAEQLRQVLYGPHAPCAVPDEPIVHTETLFDSGTCTGLWKLQGEVDRWIINAGSNPRYALTLVDRPVPVEPRVFLRGNVLNKGPDVPRQFLSLFSESDKPFQQGSGRLELAQAIVAPTNPLTARVIVNRVWTHHFGQGLVATPSDFGLRAGEPSHPELLDWLASTLIADGWSLKQLHRRILLSATFCQSSAGLIDPAVQAAAIQTDPNNRLLWRMNQHRLTFEEFRDSLLAAAGRIDLRVGGKPVKLFDPPYPTRRTLYGLVDRQFLPSSLRVFDFANPDLHIPQRTETTVPQQALFFLNHALVIDHAKTLAAAAERQDAPEAAIRGMFRQVLQRDPTEREAAESLEFIQTAGARPVELARAGVADWQYGYGAVDESSERVVGFTALPHFTGNAWQGGANWPDAQLGWVQLTADGGHPGNDRQHACVRRWTAPRAMTVEIRSALVHEAAPGDGVRAFVVSSREGQLRVAKAHQQTVDLDVERLAVEADETIDFVVDIGDVLNSDQFLWKATIAEAAEAESAAVWNSQADFPRDTVNQLGAWQQLAQVLLCTNEFLFID